MMVHDLPHIRKSPVIPFYHQLRNMACTVIQYGISCNRTFQHQFLEATALIAFYLLLHQAFCSRLIKRLVSHLLLSDNHSQIIVINLISDHGCRLHSHLCILLHFLQYPCIIFVHSVFLPSFHLHSALPRSRLHV